MKMEREKLREILQPIFENMEDPFLRIFVNLQSRGKGNPPHDWIFPGNGQGGDVAPPFNQPEVVPPIPLPPSVLMIVSAMGLMAYLSYRRNR
jgi:hypothetical protein